MNGPFFYVGAGLTAAWGIAHLFPTRSVVRGFGEINADNRRIIAMEWIVEGVALIFIGLIVLALVSLFTGFRVRFLPFRLCPFIFTLSAILILTGTLA